MHIIVWEFLVRPEKTAAFVSAYKPDGDWARLFERAVGYRGTELLISTVPEENRPQVFLTIDRWETAEDYLRFQDRFGVEYRALDAQLEGFTVSETRIGSFTTVERP